LIQRKIRVAKFHNRDSILQELILFPQETLPIGNLSTATGIQASPVISHLSLMEKQFMIPMKNVTFSISILLAFPRYPMKKLEM